MATAKIVIIITLFGYAVHSSAQIVPGAERMDDYLPLLKGKQVALVVNQTSMVDKTSLLDTLLSLHINVKKIFAPEHGFRGNQSAGDKVDNSIDAKSGLPVISLYGKNKKPQKEDLQDVDVIVYDIQDVGVRFYTYISTLHYVMEACAENNKDLLVLDRPDPNGHYVDGPVLEKAYTSFVGMDPVPIVYGMTVGEYAQMLNGEGWLTNGEKCRLKVIYVSGYEHDMIYPLPVPPSPNLPTQESVLLYPSLGLFEGTDVSVGRGTDWPFEVIGKPDFAPGNFQFTPRSIPGKAEDPPYKNKLCNGFKLTKFCDDYIKTSKELYLYWILGFYKNATEKEKQHFFTPFFDKLAGTAELRQQIELELTPDKIKASWKPGIDKFKKIRKKYLIYKDFE
jgi:uncharacterized protein YbbC (DUF1343 family)